MTPGLRGGEDWRAEPPHLDGVTKYSPHLAHVLRHLSCRDDRALRQNLAGELSRSGSEVAQCLAEAFALRGELCNDAAVRCRLL